MANYLTAAAAQQVTPTIAFQKTHLSKSMNTAVFTVTNATLTSTGVALSTLLAADALCIGRLPKNNGVLVRLCWLVVTGLTGAACEMSIGSATAPGTAFLTVDPDTPTTATLVADFKQGGDADDYIWVTLGPNMDAAFTFEAGILFLTGSE